MKLKPHTYYWYDSSMGQQYTSETVLHELAAERPPSINYCSIVRTDADGEVVLFKQHGRLFLWD